MFQDPKDEDKLCQVLKAYVEEWGPGKCDCFRARTLERVQHKYIRSSQTRIRH